jgi:putative hydrolase of the HAD superfamily
MREAELAHWRRVDNEHWSGPPSGLIQDGFHRLELRASEEQLLAVLDGYARAVDGWAKVFPDSQGTLAWLRQNRLRIGLLSNTWWAADWHNADLATHGLFPLIDEIVYTSDLPHSKPHPSVFEHVASRLGVPPEACVMVGDRPLDDIGGALEDGMRAVWKTSGVIASLPDHIEPTAVIERLGELPGLVKAWSSGG